MPRRSLYTTITIVCFGAVVGAYFEHRDVSTPPAVTERPLTRGDVTESVVATGAIQPTRSANIGSQVSGTVRALYADYNSVVRKGELIAEIDPATSQAKLDGATANEDQAKIAAAHARDALGVDQIDLDRQEQLGGQGLATEQDIETARLLVAEDRAAVVQDDDDVKVAAAGVESARTDLEHCMVRSPIDGVVISRNVDVGQSVAAGFSAPTFFVLATDLTSLTLVANVDESDVSRIRPGQDVRFTVEAFPSRVFRGHVTESRVNATSVTNVVTYQTVIDVRNPDLRLLPGMTATAMIDTASVTNVLRVPTVALRFHPTRDVLTAFHVPPKTPGVLGAAREASPDPLAGQVQATPNRVRTGDATSIDKLFKPLPPTTSAGEVWVADGGHLREIPLQLGISDGIWTQVLVGDVHEGENVVSNIVLARPVAAVLRR